MNPKQEMIATLLSASTIEKVKEQIQCGTEIISFEKFDMTFRLFLSKKSLTINLEILANTPTKVPGICVSFYKPIGYFSYKHYNLLATTPTLEVVVLKEFEDELDYWLNNNDIPYGIDIKKLSLKENAVLAAFSKEALLNAQKYEDTSFWANGLKCDIFMTFEGFPQVFLDDKYKVAGPIAAYLLYEEDSVRCIVEYDTLYQKFRDMNLLTAIR